MTDHEPHTINRGRRAIDAEFTFPVAMNKLALWALGIIVSVTGGLLLWLCISTMSLREQVRDTNALLMVMAERTNNQLEQQKIFNTELQALRLADLSLKSKIENLEINQAQHGWKREQ